MSILISIVLVPGSSKKQQLTKKFQHAPEAPGPPVSMLLIITNGCFLEGSAKRCFHTTLKLWDHGCLTVLAKVQVRWLFFLKSPVPSTARNNHNYASVMYWKRPGDMEQQSNKYAGRLFTASENIHFPHIDMTLRIWTDGVGWGGAITLNYICTETHTHTSCYATGRSLGLAQWSGAIMFTCTCTGTQIHIMLRYWMFACTHTHTHVRPVFLHLRTHTHVMLRYWTFSCARMRTHTHVVLRYWTFSCTCTCTHTIYIYTYVDIFHHVHSFQWRWKNQMTYDDLLEVTLRDWGPLEPHRPSWKSLP